MKAAVCTESVTLVFVLKTRPGLSNLHPQSTQRPQEERRAPSAQTAPTPGQKPGCSLLPGSGAATRATAVPEGAFCGHGTQPLLAANGAPSPLCSGADSPSSHRAPGPPPTWSPKPTWTRQAAAGTLLPTVPTGCLPARSGSRPWPFSPAKLVTLLGGNQQKKVVSQEETRV